MGKKDKIDYPFVEDAAIIGTWVYAGYVEHIEDFNPDAPQVDNDYLKKIKFLPNGKVRLDTRGIIEPSVLVWTKDKIINTVDETCSAYEIREINGSLYLFFEWKSGDYTIREMVPWFYVMKKEEEA